MSQRPMESTSSIDTANDIMNGYEKLKTVGKGSFGTAHLYKRLSDNILVVMKHIHFSEMAHHERSMALNEVHVLSSLEHENIIRYLGSFETDSRLVIIMEYANGGNLSELLGLKKNNDEPIAENSVLNIFSQICNGIGYMHIHKILHRDLKTANIFLTRNGIVKIGDFGISKMLTTCSGAKSVVGTPYYLSPEMCEGKEYNEKSDIWSMGCILYELICLARPFEASTLPVLIQKITAVQYNDIPPTYSDGLHRLVQVILQKDWEKRPSAQYIYQTIIPAIYENLLDADLNKRSLSSVFNRSIPKDRSVLYELHGFTTEPSLHPIKLPHKQIIDFSNSGTHFIALTLDNRVYSWGEDTYGQLGSGQASDLKETPTYVDFFRGRQIVRCYAGEFFSMFLTQFGTVLTCGNGRYGCLGHGDWNNVTKPTVINSLANVCIISLSCRSTHVLALASSGIVYIWGAAKEGQLGLGLSQHCCKPTRIALPNEVNIKEVYAGYDNSILLATNGSIIVSGSNLNNKLGLGSIPYCKKFVTLSGIEDKIKDVSLAFKHTVLLTEEGEVLCMGSNQNNQCGMGRYINGILRVQQLPKIKMITAGICYTLAASEDNVLYFWGTHYLKTLKSARERGLPANASVSATSGSQLLQPLHDGESVTESFTEVERRFRRLRYEDTSSSTFYPVVQIKPTAILALYSSPAQVQRRNIVWFAGIRANDHSVSVLVHTTAPPPIRKAEDEGGPNTLLNWNRSNRIYRNQALPNSARLS